MKQTELLADLLARNLGMLRHTLEDFSDADMLVRPCPGANHAAWQVGHLTASEHRMLLAVGAKMPELPVGFVERFTPQTAASDDPAAFATKADLLEQLVRVREGAIAWIRGLCDGALETRTTGRMADWVPTWGHLAAMMPTHVAMHLGQIQVIRRKLGKKILF